MKREIGPELVARIRHVADSLQPVERTPQPYPTPSEGSVQGEGTPPESYEENDENRMNTTTHRGIDRRAYEGDIVSRLRNWRGLHLAHGGLLFDEAADEIARLHEAVRRLADQDATLSVQGGGVTVAMDEAMSEAEIDAIECVVEDGRIASMSVYGVMRSLLVRLRPEWESQSYEESREKRTNTTIRRDATPSECSVRGEGTLTDAEREAVEFAAATCRVATRLRQARADMIGTDDEQHYWDCHDAASEIERLRLELSVQKACTVAGREEIARLRAKTLFPKERRTLAWAARVLWSRLL